MRLIYIRDEGGVFKHILSFLLATVLLLAIDTTTIAAEQTSQSNKITQHVNILEGEEGINTIAEAVDKFLLLAVQ